MLEWYNYSNLPYFNKVLDKDERRHALSANEVQTI